MEKSCLSALVTSFALLLTFSAFNAVLQKRADSTNHEIRQLLCMALAVVSSLSVAPFALHRIHPKFCFIVGCLGILFYVATSRVHIVPLSFLSDAVAGIGYSLVMVSWQQIVVRCANLHELKHGLPTNSTIGYMEAAAVSALCLSRSFGKMLSLLFVEHIPIQVVVLILCFLTLSASILVMANVDERFVRALTVTDGRSSTPMPSSTPLYDDLTFSFATPISLKSPSYNTFQLNGSGRSIHHFTVTPINDELEMEIAADWTRNDIHRSGRYVWCLSAIQMWTERRLQCLLLITMYWGFWLQFMWSEFPSTIPQRSHELKIAVVIGLVDGVMSFVVGQISDYMHRFYLIASGVLVQILIFSVHYGFLIGDKDRTLHSVAYCYVMAMLIAVADALFSTTMYTLYPLFMGQDTGAFANCAFWQSFGFTFASIVHLVGIPDVASKLIMYYLVVFLCSLPLFLSRFAMKLSRSKFHIVIKKRPSSGAF